MSITQIKANPKNSSNSKLRLTQNVRLNGAAFGWKQEPLAQKSNYKNEIRVDNEA
jgi:hypothetical protein